MTINSNNNNNNNNNDKHIDFDIDVGLKEKLVTQQVKYGDGYVFIYHYGVHWDIWDLYIVKSGMRLSHHHQDVTPKNQKVQL